MPRKTRRALLASLAGLTGVAGCTTGRWPITSDRPTGRTEGTPVGGVDTPEPLDPDHDAVEWAASFDRPLTESPTVADGTVYVAAGEVTFGTPGDGDEPRDGRLAAFDLSDGTVRSLARLPRPPAGRPVVDDGAVYVVAGGSFGLTGRAQRLVRVTEGAVDWQSERLDFFLSLLGVGAGRAFVGTSDDALAAEGQPLLAVDTVDGSTAWEAESGDAFQGRSIDDGVLAGLGGQAIARYDSADGTERWRADGELQVDAHRDVPVVDAATFVAAQGDDGEGLAAVNLADGSERWRYSDAGTDPFVVRGVAATPDVVVGLEYDGALFGLDPATGDEGWTYETDADGLQAPAAVDGTVYSAGGDTVHAVAAADGRSRWTTTVGTGLRHVLASGETVLAVRSLEGDTEVVALDPDDGRERMRYSTGSENVDVVLAGRRVILTRRSGTIRVVRG